MAEDSGWSTDLDLSFDPRTWDVGPAAEPAPTMVERGRISRFALALIGSLLILSLGAGAALMARPAVTSAS